MDVNLQRATNPRSPAGGGLRFGTQSYRGIIYDIVQRQLYPERNGAGVLKTAAGGTLVD